MKKVKQLGIWMDHSTAILMELKNDTIIESRIVSDFTHEEKEISLSKNEKLMHNKEQHQQASYYKKLSEIIKIFQEVILFGPTNATSELLNLLKTDHLFADIKVEVRHSDKMTENQKYTFVKEYFK